MAAIDGATIKSANAGRGVCVLVCFGALWLYNAPHLSNAPQ
jgi:hypothetical protein